MSWFVTVPLTLSPLEFLSKQNPIGQLFRSAIKHLDLVIGGIQSDAYM
jgi:hypothetical protein